MGSQRSYIADLDTVAEEEGVGPAGTGQVPAKRRLEDSNIFEDVVRLGHALSRMRWHEAVFPDKINQTRDETATFEADLGKREESDTGRGHGLSAGVWIAVFRRFSGGSRSWLRCGIQSALRPPTQ